MTAGSLPPLPSLTTVLRRLPLIFPEGIDHRNYLVRDIAAKTLFVMFYAGAVEGHGVWIRPNQVTRMTDGQARRTSDRARRNWAEESLRPRRKAIRGRWYADNTREPIRDETIRLGLIPLGAVLEREGLAPTSAAPRYALAEDFAALFLCDDADLLPNAADWQEAHLTAEAKARILLVRQGIVLASDRRGVQVSFPNGEMRRMSPGPSSVISKAVIEEFSRRYLERPGVILLSESRNKIVARDDQLAQAVGLSISATDLLPDIILVDLGRDEGLLIFVEVVATDGPINETRLNDLAALGTRAGFASGNLAFLTAYMSKTDAAFRKTSSQIAWGSFVWFAAEPDHIIHYRRHDGKPCSLSSLLVRASRTGPR